MSATPLGFWKLPARPDGAARHLAVITGGEAQQTMLFLQDGQWSILALFQDELAGKAAARTLDALLQSVTCLRMGGRDVLDGADTPRPGIEWVGYDREFEEADVAEQRDVEPRGRIWILPATDGASVGLKLPGHRRYDDAVAQFADVDAARAAVAAIDELLGVGPRG
ncbi:hypothetical protein [Micrococcus luteus]|uniref:hypothetical protein n=1 Tax=Micrococcus luteus TaxID=1270 RepID=UPI00080E2D8C|nr:hypothetical protein [Micrococcus luteus]